MGDTVEEKHNNPKYVSHISEDDRYESVADHLVEVAEMAASFAEPFGAQSHAYLVGLMHDVGKYSRGFQNRIRNNGPKVDHSTAGAVELVNMGCPLLAYAAAGHHAGLPNGGSSSDSDYAGTLYSRIQKWQSGLIEQYDAFRQDIVIPQKLDQLLIRPISQSEKDYSYTLAFFVRVLFSCLVDADFLCTERFMKAKPRQSLTYSTMEQLSDIFEEEIKKFYPPVTSLNKIRCEVLDACVKASELPKGFFSLTVPTGGGKTLASMRFALKHALAGEHCMRRVIYAVPYTSIIEQNASVYRSLFGDENVLEHHANYDFDDGSLSLDDANRLRLASENWDAPIIVTTNVQLFESLYSNKTSHCRKLHNLANSVIVLDEAQMLPTKQLLPCIRALVELVANYGCSVVFCTATQPSLNAILSSYNDLFVPREIVPNRKKLFKAFRRVTFEKLPPLTDEELSLKLKNHKQVLCIVNSRKEAKNVFDRLVSYDQNGAYHLTTLMYPLHRRKILEEIRNRLDNNLPCRVVATSLIEAGVDVDFPTVYRELSGVDSMIQAAGRCNRENSLLPEDAIVYLFESKDDYRLPSDSVQKMSISRAVLGSNLLALDSPEVIHEYFSELYDIRSNNLDSTRVLKRCEEAKTPFDYDFKDISQDFQMIEDGSISVIIPSEDNCREIEMLRLGTADRATMRKLMQYTVGVYENHLKKLLESGSVERVNDAEQLFLLLDEASYSDDTGLIFEVDMGEGLYW